MQVATVHKHRARGQEGSAYVRPPRRRREPRNRMSAPPPAEVTARSHPHEPVQVVTTVRASIRPTRVQRPHHQLLLAVGLSHVRATSVSTLSALGAAYPKRPSDKRPVCRPVCLRVRDLQNYGRRCGYWYGRLRLARSPMIRPDYTQEPSLAAVLGDLCRSQQTSKSVGERRS